MYAVEHGIAKSKWGGNGLCLVLNSGTPIYFAFLSWHQSSSRLVTVFLGTLWCSIEKIEAPYLSDSELWIALHAMQGNQDSSPGEGYVSWDFSSCGRNLGYIRKLQRGWPFETPLCSGKSGLLPSYDGHLGLPDFVFCIVTLVMSLGIIKKDSARLEKGQKRLFGILSVDHRVWSLVDSSGITWFF